MKSKKPENTTYPSSKVKKHRSTNNLEIVGIRAAKIQCRARADLHFTISFENQIIFRPMQLYFTVSIWFSHFLVFLHLVFTIFLNQYSREKSYQKSITYTFRSQFKHKPNHWMKKLPQNTNTSLNFQNLSSHGMRSAPRACWETSLDARWETAREHVNNSLSLVIVSWSHNTVYMVRFLRTSIYVCFIAVDVFMFSHNTYSTRCSAHIEKF